jgi:glycine/D-amino acid oxidase-like deaminating enzyme
MLKKQIIVAPVAEDLYWAGANYYWEYADTNPTPKGLQFIENELNIMLQSPYQIVDHSAAVRPVIKDRRPIMGWSQKNPKIGIFNGLGSKGALLAPWCAAHFVANLCQNSPIDSELDVQRFDQTS